MSEAHQAHEALVAFTLSHAPTAELTHTLVSAVAQLLATRWGEPCTIMVGTVNVHRWPMKRSVA